MATPGSETLVAGGYTATYGGVALGMFEGDQGLPTLEHTTKSESIANTSVYGKSTIDDIGQGADWFLQMTCMEYKTGPISAFWPYGVALGQMGTIGLMLTSLAAAVVLTAISGTTAASSPATLTASKCLLLPGFATRLLYGPTLRKVPLRFRLYPYTSSVVLWFTQT